MTVVDVEANWPPGPLPWQVPLYERFCRIARGGTVPHAVLLHGAEGLGKTRLAAAWATGLLCKRTPPSPCGDCDSCVLVKGGAHADMRWLRPEDGKRAIGVEAIRAAVVFMQKTPSHGGYKVLIIEPAESMTPAAANALLKTLEEPPGQALLILVSNRVGALLATVRSRCQSSVVSKPGPVEAAHWIAEQAACSDETAAQALDIAAGSPLAALELIIQDRLAGRLALFKLFDQLTAGELRVSEAVPEFAPFDVDVLLETALQSAEGQLRSCSGSDRHHEGFYRRDRLLSLVSAHRQGINFGRETLVTELARILAGRAEEGM